ncbi:MAG: UDP-N-acetylmuramoyl-tripeptide--D-alanyl-D-alanine ligase [Oscillospiraceae bacterium]|nr:UDP-N-acetylmuramoyl-tripeptide--D-alanyl-D-alanine ligase [Oscillospiraceae bacterium]
MREKLKTLAGWIGAQLEPEDEEILITGVQTDSRKVKQGDIFVALRGKKMDGHDYISQAVEKGAAAVLVSRDVQTNRPKLFAEDTLLAYGALAAGYRKTLDAKTVAVTGSVGKTTTKEMIAAVLSAEYPTAKSEGNHNNAIGVPMSILEAPTEARWLVLEMGMNHFGELSYLTSIARPDVAVITNIGTAHIEHLGSREGILKAKLEILEGLDPAGVCVWNGDEPMLWERRKDCGFTVLTFGIKNQNCDFIAEDVRQLDGGMSFRVCGKGHHFEVFVPQEGEHIAMNALAAIAVGLNCGIRPEKIQTALSTFMNTGMRQQIMDHEGVTIIADCYNAGPESMAASLKMLGSHPTKGNRIAVLGDMLELGNRSAAEHYRVGRLSAKNADILLTYGANATRVVAGAITGGMDPKNCRCFQSHEEMAEMLAVLAKPGDAVLFKGSRGMRMENVMHLYQQRTQRT